MMFSQPCKKSIRGSDVDASLHYAARLIEAGDLPSLARRLTVIAYEDIGLATLKPDSYRDCSGCCPEDWVPRSPHSHCQCRD